MCTTVISPTPWDWLVTQLGCGTPPPPSSNSLTPGRKDKRDVIQETLRVWVTARPREFFALVTWCDSTSAHYCDQVWRACVARTSGLCSISGAAIRRGDLVYRPRNTVRCKANAGAMILAYYVESAVELDDYSATSIETVSSIRKPKSRSPLRARTRSRDTQPGCI